MADYNRFIKKMTDVYPDEHAKKLKEKHQENERKHNEEKDKKEAE